MNSIDIKQFEQQFFELVETAQDGKETVVTKEGKPVLKHIPFTDKPNKTNTNPITSKPAAHK